MGVALDISAQVKARQELDEYRRQMEKHARDAEVGTLSATMGRQIAEPLSVAQLTLEKLLGEMGESGISSDAARHAVGRGLCEIAKAGEILGQFLNIAHPGFSFRGAAPGALSDRQADGRRLCRKRNARG